MRGKVTIDQAGRLVIPKAAREVLGIIPGDPLTLEIRGDELTLRVDRRGAPLVKEKGVWVLRAGGTLTQEETNELVSGLRESTHNGLD